MTQYKDWRGTTINVGDTVIYGAPIGRSIALVEGTVDSFTKSGRVNVRIVRRAYSYSDHKDVVHVGADRLTIVEKLPDTTMPTAHEAKIISCKEGIKNMEQKRQAYLAGTETPYRPEYGVEWCEERIADYEKALIQLESRPV